MRIRLFSLAKASLVSLMMLLGLGTAHRAVAQLNPNLPVGSAKSNEITTNDSFLPLVYSQENSGATPGSIEGISVSYGSPAWPSFANLPIIRPFIGPIPGKGLMEPATPVSQSWAAAASRRFLMGSEPIWWAQSRIVPETAPSLRPIHRPIVQLFPVTLLQ